MHEEVHPRMAGQSRIHASKDFEVPVQDVGLNV